MMPGQQALRVRQKNGLHLLLKETRGQDFHHVPYWVCFNVV